jgi:hypothetical protein
MFGWLCILLGYEVLAVGVRYWTRVYYVDFCRRGALFVFFVTCLEADVYTHTILF